MSFRRGRITQCSDFSEGKPDPLFVLTYGVSKEVEFFLFHFSIGRNRFLDVRVSGRVSFDVATTIDLQYVTLTIEKIDDGDWKFY